VGALNYGGMINHPLLSNGVCPICNKKGIKSDIGDAGRLSFDYRCKSCNPNVIIVVTDIVLQSDMLDELIKKPSVRQAISDEIENWEQRIFELNSSVLSALLDEELSSNFITYSDWHHGNVIGVLKDSQVRSQDELRKIRTEQLEIFDKRVSEKLAFLKDDFLTRRQRSYNQLKHLEIELNDVLDIIIEGRYQLTHKYAKDDEIQFGSHLFKYKQWEFVKKMYNKAARGTIDFSLIPSEKQIYTFSRSQVNAMIDAVAFGQFYEFLNNDDLNKYKNQSNTMANFQGSNFGPGASIIIGNGNSITNRNSFSNVGNIDALKKELKKHNLDDESVEEISMIVKEEVIDSSTNELGPKAKTWFSKMMGKVADGSWKVGIGVATKVLIDALNKYYGIL